MAEAFAQPLSSLAWRNTYLPGRLRSPLPPTAFGAGGLRPHLASAKGLLLLGAAPSDAVPDSAQGINMALRADRGGHWLVPVLAGRSGAGRD